MGLGARDPPGANRLLQLVLILPLPGSVRRDLDIEEVITRLESVLRSPQRLLQVHVPLDELPRRRTPFHNDCVRLPQPGPAQPVRATPGTDVEARSRRAEPKA